jgi:hypothetical protein
MIVYCTCAPDTAGTHQTKCPLNNPPVNANVVTGWVCALCGASNAPSVARCACSPAEAVATKRLLLG